MFVLFIVHATTGKTSLDSRPGPTSSVLFATTVLAYVRAIGTPVLGHGWYFGALELDTTSW
ncbi:MAG: hypothetical protein Q6353_014200, partial [Candidatus Sigynarchaeum springense]